MIRTLIVDEILLVAQVLSTALLDEDDIDVADYTTDQDEALTTAHDYDIVLVSTTIPYNGALHLANELTKTDVKVIVLGMPQSEQTIVQYVSAGAAGYVMRGDPTDDLLETIRAVSDGKASVSPTISSALMKRLAELIERCGDKGINLDPLSELTLREREVLSLIGQQLNNREIATELGLEVGTVKNYVHRIFAKLNVDNRRAAMVHALREARP